MRPAHSTLSTVLPLLASQRMLVRGDLRTEGRSRPSRTASPRRRCRCRRGRPCAACACAWRPPSTCPRAACGSLRRSAAVRRAQDEPSAPETGSTAPMTIVPLLASVERPKRMLAHSDVKASTYCHSQPAHACSSSTDSLRRGLVVGRRVEVADEVSTSSAQAGGRLQRGHGGSCRSEQRATRRSGSGTGAREVDRSGSSASERSERGGQGES